MTRVLLINPNTSQATTAMMVAIAQATMPGRISVVGATASQGPPMIVDPVALDAAGAEVLAMGIEHAGSAAGVIVGAFGDPGLGTLRLRLAIPVVGIAEAAMREAARNGRRFGIATVTPRLLHAIGDYARALGLGPQYAGTRLTPDDPMTLLADPARLIAALADAVTRCIQEDGADAVVIGGGPLGAAATVLAGQYSVPVIAPIPAAVRRLAGMLGDAT